MRSVRCSGTALHWPNACAPNVTRSAGLVRAHTAALRHFASLDRRIDLDGFTRQLREGLVSGHPDMPTFRFSREDARALTAYLRAIQQQ